MYVLRVLQWVSQPIADLTPLRLVYTIALLTMYMQYRYLSFIY